MPKLNRKFANAGSLRKSDGRYIKADAAWNEKKGGFIIVDAKAKRRYGPFVALHNAKAAGVVFHADGGRRAA